MPSECPGCEARQDEIRHLRAQVQELTDRAIANANPGLAMQVKNPHPSMEPALTSFEDGLGNQFVMVEGKTVPLRDWQKFISEKGGFLDGEGRYIPKDEYERVQAKINEMMGGEPPTPQ